MKIIAGLLTFLFTLGPVSGWAVCGDVTGDGQVKSGDALAVLKKSVGGSVKLTCQESGIRNIVRFGNPLTCAGDSITIALIDIPTGRTWASDTGFYSLDQGTTEKQLGPFLFLGAPCTEPLQFNGTIDLPPGVRVLIMVQYDGSSLTLQFYDEGPVNAGRSALRPFETLTADAPWVE